LKDLNEVNVLRWRAEIFRDSLDDEVQNGASETNVDTEQVRQEEFNHFIKLHDGIESCKKIDILSFNGNTQWKSVLVLVNVVIDTEADDVSVLGILLRELILFLAVFDVFFDTLVDKNVSEVVIGSDVKIFAGFEGVCQAFIVIAQVEVQFGE
jgi:hypothetical protein